MVHVRVLALACAVLSVTSGLTVPLSRESIPGLADGFYDSESFVGQHDEMELRPVQQPQAVIEANNEAPVHTTTLLHTTTPGASPTTHSHLHRIPPTVPANSGTFDESDSENADDGELVETANLPDFEPRGGPAYRERYAWTDSGREEMRAREGDPLDADCDSPQIGEAEVYPKPATNLNMNAISSSSNIPEQPDAERESLMDSDRYRSVEIDHPSVGAGSGNATVEPVDGPDRRGGAPNIPELPPADPDTTKTKCSKARHGHDVPDELDEMSDDCGMPEPTIPCETVGNTTRCEPVPELLPPPLPARRVMPAIPAPAYTPIAERIAEVAVEFPDYGVSRTIHVSEATATLQAILRAGQEFGISEEHVHTIRNAGADVPANRRVYQLEDKLEIVAYLNCATKPSAPRLIIRLPLCPDLHSRPLEARVEIPETDDVVTTGATSKMQVGSVLRNAGVTLENVEKVTYNGARVAMNHTLEYLHFADKSVLVVYLHPSALPSWVAHPTGQDQLSTSDDGNGDDSANGAPVTPPPAGTPFPNIPATPPADNDHDDWPRPLMTTPAVVTMHPEAGATFLDFPILVRPEDSGHVMFDALEQRTGRPAAAFSIVFHNIRIETQTTLKEFGFRVGDIVSVQMLPPQP